MSQDLQRLVVSLEAKVDKFTKAMDRANGVATKRSKTIEDRFSKLNKKVTAQFANLGKGLLAGVAAGGIAGIINQFGEVAKSIANIGNEAARAGVTTDVFQQWKHVADQARIPVDALVDAFKELNIRGDEFATTAKGSAAEAFARLGLTPTEVKERIKDPAEFMLLLIERTKQLKDTAAATRIFDELFGGTGAEKLVALLDQSTGSIRATIDEANRLGLVLDEDVIARAAEIDRQFAIVSKTVGSALKGAIVSAASALQDFIDSFRAFENQQNSSLDAQVATIGKQRLDLENKILKLRGQQQDSGFNVFGQDYDSDIAYLEAERAALGETEAQILRVIEARRKAAEVPAATSGGGGWTPAPYTAPSTGGGRDKAAEQAEREAEAVRRLIAELEHEKALVGATDLEYEISNTLRQAGAAATHEQRAKITALVSAIYAEEQALRNATEASQELRDLGRDVLGGIVGDLREGKDAADILASALDNVADRLANMALDSLFGGLGAGGAPLGGLHKLNLRRAA